VASPAQFRAYGAICMHWVCRICYGCFANDGEIMEFTPTQQEILRTVFRQMDQELGIKPLTEEQMKAFNIDLKEEDEDNQQV
jgi:predicted Fe-S protein YdhL (DUF1289 family)